MNRKPPIDLQVLFETHGAFVSRLARAMVADEHTAEDLAHETWAAVVSRPPVGVRDVRAWLATVLQRRIGDHRRRTRKNVGLESAEFTESSDAALTSAAADEAAQRLEAEHMLQSAVRALEEPYRSTIYLRFHQGLPPRAIAARMGAPVKTVKTRLSRGLERLRADLDRGMATSADPKGNWRYALALLAALPESPTGLVSTASAVQLGGAATPLLLGMKKLIVVAAALLLSIGLLSRFSSDGEPGDAGGVSAPEDALTAAPAATEVELVSIGAVSTGSGEGDADSRTPAAQAPHEPVLDLADAETPATLVVNVRHADGTVPVDRPILLRASSWTSGGEPPIVRRTDQTGRVVFAGLFPVSYFVADAHGGAEESLQLDAGETETLNLTIKTEVTIHGQVVDHRGDPAAGADIWCAASLESGKVAWPVGIADSGGQFVLRCSPKAGLQATLAGRLPGELQSVAALVDVEPDVREVELVLGHPGSPLAGRVVDVNGKPIPDAQVLVQAAHPKALVTQSDGRFESAGDLPEGEFSVVIRATGYAPTFTNVHMGLAAVEAEFVLHRGVEISGTVLSPDGTPAWKAHVWVASPSSRWQVLGHGPGSSTRSDKEGHFRLRRVAPGPVALRAQAGWTDVMSTGELLLEVQGRDERSHNLQLTVGRSIKGWLVDSEGLPVAGGVVTAFNGSVKSKDTRAEADGYFLLGALPEPDGTTDEWDLVVRAWTGTTVRLLGKVSGVVPNGDEVELVVERMEEATGTLMGRVEADSSPIPGDIEARLVDQNADDGGALAFDRNTGAFTKGPLVPGTYRIELIRGGLVIGTQPDLRVEANDTLDAGVVRVGDGEF